MNTVQLNRVYSRPGRAIPEQYSFGLGGSLESIMNDRITQKDLECLTDRINKVTDSPPTTHTKGDDGHFTPNPGNYHLSYAYGGVKLERMCNERGGVNTASTGGFGTKRELYNWMQAFLAGIAVKN